MTSKIKNYFDHLGYNSASKEAKNTFIGVILVKFGTGAIGIWGIINIYFFSYFQKKSMSQRIIIIIQNDENLRMSEFSFLITFAAIPMSVVAIFSVRIAQHFGFEKIIRGAMIINPISIMLGSTQDNFYTFALFNTFIASLCFGSTVMPILYCLWAHFPKKTGNATGIALASFGLSTFFYSIIATNIVNPENIPAKIEYTEGSQTYYLFEDDVSDNVPSMTFWLGLIQLFFCVPGAFLITNNKDSQITNNIESKENQTEKDIEMNSLEQGKDTQGNYKDQNQEKQNKNQISSNSKFEKQTSLNEDIEVGKIQSGNKNKQLTPSGQQYLLDIQYIGHKMSFNEEMSFLQKNTLADNKEPLIPQQRQLTQSKISLTSLFYTPLLQNYEANKMYSQQSIAMNSQQNIPSQDTNQVQNNQNKYEQNNEKIQDQIQANKQLQINQDKPQMTLMQAAKTLPFIIIYVSTFLLSCFSLFISINFKTYGLTKINDDHFLTYLITVCTFISSLSNIGWGYLVDKYNFRSVYLNLIIVIFCAGFIFPYISSTKVGFFIIYQILGASERGLYTIIGPGLVQIFGVKLGAELFPIKSTSFFLALVVLPVFQMFLLDKFDYDQTIHVLLIGIVVAYLMSFQLQTQYNFYKG